MRIASALILFVITVLVGGFGTLATLTSATSLQSASLAEPPSYPPEPSTHVLAETDTATPYTLSEFAHDSTDPIGDQSLNAKIARMIAVALQLRPLPITTQTTGTYAQGYTDADLERVLDIARRNNENTRSDINRSITDVTDGGTLQNVTIENGILDGLSVTGSTNFMSNVGIGTSTPSSKLHVTGGNEWLSMQIDGTVQPGINLVSNHINSSNGWHIMNEGNVDRFTIRESGTGASVFSVENGAAASGGRVYITSAGNVGIGTISPLARLSVKGAGTTTGQLAQFTDSSNNPKVTVLDNGNIGIGTAMPAYTLHLAGTAPATDTDIALVPFDSSSKSTLRVFNSSGFQTQVTTFPSSSSVIWGVPIGDTSVYYSDGASTIYMNAGAGNSYFGTNGMVRQTISNTGNVGIGTTTPLARLSVKGAGTGTDLLAQFADSANSPKLTVLDNGNIGIGTTTPLNKLHIFRDSTPASTAFGDNTGVIRITSSNQNSGWLMLEKTGAGAGAWNWSVQDSGALSLSEVNVASNRMVVAAGGYIGVGIGSPQTKLQVAGVIAPSLDNTYTLGNATYRFSEVYAANGVINTSDERLKDNIATLTYGLDAINNLQPVSFSWKDNPEQGSKLGLLAQDVELIIPEIVVRGDDPNHTLGIRYSELIPVLIRAIQELSQKVEALATQTFDTLFAKKIVVENVAADRGHFSEEIQTDGRLCVGSTCVTEAEFLQMVLQAKQAPVTEPAQSSASDPNPISNLEAPADESVPSAQSESEDETVVAPTEPDESNQSAETENVETPTTEEQNDTATTGANTESTPDDTPATTAHAPTEELDPKEEPAEQEDSGSLPDTDTSNS